MKLINIFIFLNKIMLKFDFKIIQAKVSSTTILSFPVYAFTKFSGLSPGLYIDTLPSECLFIPRLRVSLSKS